jgi:hypothetical protein
MWKQPPVQNRFVDEMDRQRLYKQHLKALAAAKPSLDTHQTATRKFLNPKHKRRTHRIFDGSKIQEEFQTQKAVPEFDIFSARSEPVSFQLHLPVADPVKLECRATRGIESARPVHSNKRLRDRNTTKREKIGTDPIRRPREAPAAARSVILVEDVSEIRSEEPPPKAESGVAFGADMWETSDETEEQVSAIDCFELIDDDDNDF